MWLVHLVVDLAMIRVGRLWFAAPRKTRYGGSHGLDIGAFPEATMVKRLIHSDRSSSYRWRL